jgi:hypothetical protein
MNEVSIIINGIEYIPVDTPSDMSNQHCKDCDIFKARPPQNGVSLPLCCEKEYNWVNKSCFNMARKNIRRIWKIK